MFPDLPTVPLPKRVKSKWEDLNELCDLVDKHGPLIPLSMAAELLDLSTQRLYQLKAAGKLETIDFRNRTWVSEQFIRGFIEDERKAGRPWHEPTKKQLWKKAQRWAKGSVKK